MRIVDLSQALAGPYATGMLADMGAAVVKVEPPTGDHFRPLGGGAIFHTVNRGKRSVVLDLKTDAGRAGLEVLVREADVFVESFVPGVIERLGFSFDRVRELRPGIVYCSISGFGRTGPYRDQPGYDVVGQAMSGIMAATGEAGRPPVRVGGSLVDVGTGLHAAVAILAALRDREATGAAHHVEVSLFESAVAMVPHFFALYSMTGQVRARQGSRADLGVPYENFATLDGFVFVGCTTDRHWQALCTHLGAGDLGSDERLATGPGRMAHRDEVARRLGEVFAAMPTDEAVDLLRAAHVPSGPVLQVDQVMEDPHLGERAIWATLDDPEKGRIVYPRPPIRWDGEFFGPAGPAPRLGEHGGTEPGAVPGA